MRKKLLAVIIAQHQGTYFGAALRNTYCHLVENRQKSSNLGLSQN